jgi:hypothetical protein
MKDDQTMRGESEQANGVGDEDTKRDREEDEDDLTQNPTVETYNDDEKEDETAAKDITERAILFVFDPASTATHLTKEGLSKHLRGDADSEITGVLHWMTRSGFLGPELPGKGRRIEAR